MNDYIKNLENKNEELLEKCNEVTSHNELFSRVLFNVMMVSDNSRVNLVPIQNSSGEFIYEFKIKPTCGDPIVTILNTKEEVEIVKGMIYTVEKLKNAYMEKISESMAEIGKLI